MSGRERAGKRKGGVRLKQCVEISIRRGECVGITKEEMQRKSKSSERRYVAGITGQS